MKSIKIFSIISIALILFTSCEKEEKGTPEQQTKTYTFSGNIRGSEGIVGMYTLAELNLSDVIGADAARNLENAQIQLAESRLEISGLSQLEGPEGGAVVLEDLTIMVGSRQGVNLGNCSTDPQGQNEFPADIEQSTNVVVNLIRNIFTDVTSGSKSVDISVSFTPNVNITSSDNIQLKITFGGTYNYLVF